jgi:hypothetical protein
MSRLRLPAGPRTAGLLLVSLTLSLAVPALLEAPAGADGTDPVTTFTGADGLTYQSAPTVVDGADGEMFYGPELDVACAVADKLAVPMKGLSKLARILERSGRTVVFTVAPNKSSVLGDDLTAPPHGTCDTYGIKAQDRVLDHYRDPAYLPMRRALLGQQRQMYWKTDLHWTTVGGAEYAKALATRLSPRLGRHQKYVYGTETRLGFLAAYRGLDQPETLQEASPGGKVRVRNAPGDTWSGYPEFTFSNAWSSRPSGLTWPGRTLLLGDSFMWYALENLRPVFRHGQFLWFVHTEEKKVLRGIRRSDTVVIEVHQYGTPGTPIATAAFRHDVKQVLRQGHGHRARGLFAAPVAARGPLL